MHDLLIYLTDTEYADEVRHLFSGNGLRVTVVDNLEKLGELLQQELYDLILVWTSEFEKLSNMVTLLQVDKYDYLPVIAVTANAAAAAEMGMLPVVDLLTIPMPREEFLYRINAVMEDSGAVTTVLEGSNWQGGVEEYNLVDLIQMIENRGVDAALTMTCNGKSGQVLFRKGKVVDAQFQTVQGMNALKKMSFWPHGNFKTKLSRIPESKDQFRMSNQDILMILVEHLLKQNRLFDNLPELDESIQLAPNQSTKELTPLQHRICNYCEQPTSILDLLLSLGDQNEDILTELHLLINQGVLGKSGDIRRQIESEEQQSGLGRLVSSFSSLFRKKPETKYFGADYFEEQEESFDPTLEVSGLKLGSDEQTRIRQKIEQLRI